MDTIILRRDAAARALPKYFTGKPCGRGHVASRYTKTGVCCSCAVESARIHNSRVNRQVAVKQGALIVYKLVNDADFDAAWAYLQALDMARGGTPTPNPRLSALQPADIVEGPDIEAARAHAFMNAQQYKDKADPPRSIGNRWELDGK